MPFETISWYLIQLLCRIAFEAFEVNSAVLACKRRNLLTLPCNVTILSQNQA